MPPQDIRDGYRKHAALAQFYRWFQLYENNDIPLANQLAILSPTATVKSGLGEAKGHDAYSARIAQLPKAWKNAHVVRSVRVDIKSDGSSSLNAGIVYLNQGMKPGITRSAELSYAVNLGKGEPLLPTLQTITINQNSEGTVPAFTPAYDENRLKSLLHYWLALVEDPARNLDPFHEILAAGFVLNFTSGRIASTEEFETWFRGPASSVAASTHVVSDFKNDGFNASFDLDWAGNTHEGQNLTAKTRHTWKVIDDPKHRFAKIKKIDVEMLKPFTPG